MTSDILESQIKEIIAQLTRVAIDEIDATKKASFYGIDSMGQLELREILERRFQINIDDRTFNGFNSINEITSFLEAQQNALPVTSTGTPASLRSAENTDHSSKCRLTPSGVLYDDIEIGLSLTCLNNLGETPLLKYLGDLRWKHLTLFTGVPSKLFADTEGHRLFPTFFYVEMAFPPHSPMAAYGENDRIKIAGTLKRFGGSMLDGLFYLLPADYPETDESPFAGITPALAANVPVVRMSNIFVKQVNGSESIRTGRPANSGFKNIAEAALAPELDAAMKQAEKGSYLALPGDSYVPMTAGPIRIEYPLVVDRDFSSTGLVYFANYPTFLDICEREVLASAKLPLPEEMINKRTVTTRKSVYLNNASAKETLVIEVEPWIENPLTGKEPAPEAGPIRLFINYRMYRKSDAKLMMVSTAEKLIFGVPFVELPFFSQLLATPLV